jgi:hypothetical protein
LPLLIDKTVPLEVRKLLIYRYSHHSLDAPTLSDGTVVVIYQSKQLDVEMGDDLTCLSIMNLI